MQFLIDEDIPHDGIFNSLGEVRTFPGRSPNALPAGETDSLVNQSPMHSPDSKPFDSHDSSRFTSHDSKHVTSPDSKLSASPDSTPAASLAAAEALIIRSVTRIDANLLDRAPRLRFIGTITTGIDHVDVSELARRGITLAHAAGSNALPVAEYVLAAMTLMKSGLPFGGRTLGIIGRGRIGTIVAEWADKLGMTVLACDPPLARTGQKGLVSFETLAAACDFITIHVPLTRDGLDATSGMVNAGWLNQLRPGAMLINTSRGEIVDEDALCDALQTGRLAGAAIDVWRNEPAINPRLVTASSLATPHIAGYSVESRRRAVILIRDAWLAWSKSPIKSAVSSRSSPSTIGTIAAGVAANVPLPDPPHIETLVAILDGWSDRLRQASADPSPAAVFDALRREAQTRREFLATEPTA